MGREGIAPVEIGTHAGDDAHVALFRGGDALAEEIAAMQVFSVAMERDLRGIERKNTGDADKDDIGIRGVPVVGPLFNIHDGRIMLGHIALSDAANLLLPGLAGDVDWSQARRQRDEVGRGTASD